jgi:hypothetical protein
MVSIQELAIVAHIQYMLVMLSERRPSFGQPEKRIG